MDCKWHSHVCYRLIWGKNSIKSLSFDTRLLDSEWKWIGPLVERSNIENRSMLTLAHDLMSNQHVKIWVCLCHLIIIADREINQIIHHSKRYEVSFSCSNEWVKEWAGAKHIRARQDWTNSMVFRWKGYILCSHRLHIFGFDSSNFWLRPHLTHDLIWMICSNFSILAA